MFTPIEPHIQFYRIPPYFICYMKTVIIIEEIIYLIYRPLICHIIQLCILSSLSFFTSILHYFAACFGGHRQDGPDGVARWSRWGGKMVQMWWQG